MDFVIATIIAFMNGFFWFGTFYFANKISLNAGPKNHLAGALPILMMLPRLIFAATTISVGHMVFKINSDAMMLCVFLMLGFWVIMMTFNILYVQLTLQKKKQERDSATVSV